MNPLIVQVDRAINSYPLGATFTTNDICKLVTYAYATTTSISMQIRKSGKCENITPPRKMAIWRRIA